MLFELCIINKNYLGYNGIIIINNITNNDIRYILEFNTIKTNIIKIDDMKVQRINNIIRAEIKDHNKKLNIGETDILTFTGIGNFPNIKDLKIILTK